MADDNALFIQFRGRVLGPFTREQLQQMATRGQLTRMHRISSDQRTWKQASEYREFFADRAIFDDEQSVADEDTPQDVVPPKVREAPETDILWYYVVDEQQHGPVTKAELADRLQAGIISRLTLVWREGAGNWTVLEEAIPSLIGVQKSAVENQSGGASVPENRPASPSIARTLDRHNAVVMANAPTFAGVLLVAMHFPNTDGETYQFWWNLASTPASMVLGVFLVLGGIGQIVVALTVSGPARGIVQLALAAVTLLVGFTAFIQADAVNQDTVFAVTYLLLIATLIALGWHRHVCGETHLARVLQGIAGGMAIGAAIIATLLFFMELADSQDLAIGSRPALGVGIAFVGLGHLAVLSAGICAICNLGIRPHYGANLASLVCSMSAFVLLGIGVVLAIGGAIGTALDPFGGTLDASETVHLYLRILQAVTIFAWPFIVVAIGLHDLLTCLELRVLQRRA